MGGWKLAEYLDVVNSNSDYISSGSAHPDLKAESLHHGINLQTPAVCRVITSKSRANKK